MGAIFKKGDKVRAKVNYGASAFHFHAGRVYTITRDSDDSTVREYAYITRDDTGKEGGYFTHDFVLIVQPVAAGPWLPKKGDFVVAKQTSKGNEITKGKVYEVAADTREHPATYKESLVALVKNDRGEAGSAFVRRFEPSIAVPPVAPAPLLPLPASEVSQGRHFEVRSASTQLSAPKAITRKSHLSEAEQFVLDHAGNYNGDFEIVEVQIIQRTTVLRKVKRAAVTTYKLVDA